MPEATFIALVQNAALLLAMALLYDVGLGSPTAPFTRVRQAGVGVLLGTIGVAVMLTPFEYAPGIVFDTRSVLLGVAGIFFGAIPTAVAMAMTAALRLSQGGAAALTGVAVILASGCIGIAWRDLRGRGLEDLSLREGYLFGLVVHVVMLALMFTLPWAVAVDVIAGIGMPVIVIYPVATALLVGLMVSRLRRERVRDALRRSEVRLLDVVEEQRATETALRESEGRYRGLVLHAPLAIFVNRDDRVALVNDACLRLFGAQREEELLGRSIFELFRPDERASIGERIGRRRDRLRDIGELVEPVEQHIVRLDGRVVDVEVTASAFEDGGSVVVHVVLNDITERKQAVTEIRRLNEDLEQRVVARTAELEGVNEELEAFSYTVSHDLRAPLRAINGFASILARRYRDGLDEKGRHYVDTIVQASDHMGILIEELLGYSRLGRRSVRAEPAPLGPLVTQLRSTYGERIAAAGGTLEIVDPLAVPVGDPTLIERVLANLVDNALVYRRPEVAPHVTLSATRHGRTVTLAVADNGIGIPAEYREKIFEVFARLHADDAYPGTGIGLAIVRKAARLMGSEVTVASSEGVGTTFSLDLPAVDERSTSS